jgi:hypothetical protein
MKKYLILFILAGIVILAGFIFFRYFFTYEQRNRVMRSVESVTGQNLTITVYDMNGKIIKRYAGIQKITTGEPDRRYVYFYTPENKYVQIPDSVWFIAEEQ